jgi:hypothetical protein
MSSIPDAKHSAVDLHARPVLIQLLEADDGVPQRRDVVDTAEHSVLAGLRDKDDGSGTLDLHG